MLANPSDDARAVYADALIEVGDPRGDFINVQLEIARRGGSPKQTAKTKPLWDRFRRLHSGHSAKWAKPIRAIHPKATWEFHRGFVRRVHLERISSVAAFAAAMAIEPIVDLVLDEATVGSLDKLFDQPGIERLNIGCTTKEQNAILMKRFGAGFVTEREPGWDWLPLGVAGISK